MSRLPLFAQEVKLRRGGDVAMMERREEGGGERWGPAKKFECNSPMYTA